MFVPQRPLGEHEFRHLAGTRNYVCIEVCINGGYPKMVVFCGGKSHLEMDDDWG